MAVGFVIEEIALAASRRMCCGGCRVVAAATAVPALLRGQIWPSPACGACAGMVTFVAISSGSTMVVRVFWRVARRFC